MMLTALNTLFNSRLNWSICINHSNNDNFLRSDLQRDVHLLHQKIISTPPKVERWLLLTDNPYYFIVGLLTLLGMNNKVIISSNKTSLWLSEISEHYDGILSNENSHFSIEYKQNITINQVKVTDSHIKNQWKPLFSGDECLTFYTSGSTGKAKAIEKKLRHITNEVETLDGCFNRLTTETIFISSVSHFHIYGLLFNLFWPLLTKRRWLNTQIEYQEQLMEQLTLDKDFVFISSPAFLSRLDQNHSIYGIEHIFSSGGPLKFNTAQTIEKNLGNLPFEVFGSTETGGIAFRQQSRENDLWHVFDQIKLKPSNDRVELISPHISNKHPVFLDDRIEFYKDNKFLLLGRNDRIVKLEEKRISLDEIETFLNQLDSISECLAIVVKAKRTVIGCVVILSPNGRENYKKQGKKQLVSQIKLLMRDRFESVTIPKKWRFLDAIPVNAQSKIDHPLLQQLFSENSSASK